MYPPLLIDIMFFHLSTDRKENQKDNLLHFAIRVIFCGIFCAFCNCGEKLQECAYYFMQFCYIFTGECDKLSVDNWAIR